MSLKILI